MPDIDYIRGEIERMRRPGRTPAEGDPPASACWHPNCVGRALLERMLTKSTSFVRSGTSLESLNRAR